MIYIHNINNNIVVIVDFLNATVIMQYLPLREINSALGIERGVPSKGDLLFVGRIRVCYRTTFRVHVGVIRLIPRADPLVSLGISRLNVEPFEVRP